MSRQKITEFTAKQLLYPALSLNFNGMAASPKTTVDQIKKHFGNQNLVVKVDQGIKKRGLQGLVKVNVTPSEIPPILKSWAKQGWTQFLIEPVLEHDNSSEQYLALERTRAGWSFRYSRQGGVDIESHWETVSDKLPTLLQTKLTNDLLPVLDASYISFLEINPVLIRTNQLIPLDMAVLVDSAGSSLPTIPDRVLAASEQQILELDNSTPASLKFRLINPTGRIWMLLSGGGASLVLADEVADVGLGAELANYGEYSGAPSDDDVYSYTSIILKQLLLAKHTHSQALVVAGGVANFTDVKKTFSGLIRALLQQASALKRAKVKVFVRRGGPNEAAGLTAMRTFLDEHQLLGSVYGHDTPLTQVITDVKNYLKS